MTHPTDPSGFLADNPPAHAIWHWRLEDSAGGEVSAPATAGAEGPRFTSQSDAESWVGEVWRQLREEGVEAVTLFEGDRLVYGPMSLDA